MKSRRKITCARHYKSDSLQPSAARFFFAMASTEELKEECPKFSRWGLGRGINITKKTPWVEKTAFQVRPVKPEDLIETDDGELLKAYSEEVGSRTTVKSDVQAGIKPTNLPVCVRMDVEYTRSTLSSKYVVGTKIKRRTISFRMDFADVPQSLMKNVEEAKDEARRRPPLAALGKSHTWSKRTGSIDQRSIEDGPRRLKLADPIVEESEEPTTATEIDGATPNFPKNRAQSLDSISPREINRPISPCGSVVDEVLSMPEGSSFEERLGFWIKNCLQRQGYCPSSQNFQDMVHSPEMDQGKRTERMKVIESFLDHFVQEFGVAHYVSAIELGALEYKELTSKEFYNRAKLSTKASLSAASYGGVEASQSQSFMKSRKSEKSERKKIGVMKKEKVDEEAVIGCSFCPISTLIKMPYLQHALKNSIDKYVIEASKGTL